MWGAVGAPTQVNPLLDAALAYREAGLCPIPVEPRGKKPLVQWAEFQHRMPAIEEITAWWTLEPAANIALIAGRGMLVVDVDGPEGAAALASAGIVVDTAPCSRTARGHHYFFAGTAPDRIGLFPQVDVRGVGYVVAPPSVHETGAVYTWDRPIVGALPPMPATLEVALRRPLVRATDPSGLDWFTAALTSGVSEGSRDATCTRLAGYLLGKNIEPSGVDTILQYWAGRCVPAFPPEQVSKCVASIAKREGEPDGPPHAIAEAVSVTVADILNPSRAKPAASRLAGLDSLLAGGFYPGEYILMGSRPSVGKTALALQIARAVARQGRGVLVASTEMTVTALVRRMLSQESEVHAENLKTGRLNELEQRMLAGGAAGLAGLPMWVTSSVHSTVQLADAMSVYAPGALGLIIADYLQLFSAARETRDARSRVEAVSKDFRRMAIQYEIPVLALSSLSRPPKDRPNWRPSLADLRESGELEHDADIVLLLHRALDSPDTELEVAKDRDGRTGMVKLYFTPQTLTFRGKP